MNEQRGRVLQLINNLVVTLLDTLYELTLTLGEVLLHNKSIPTVVGKFIRDRIFSKFLMNLAS